MSRIELIRSKLSNLSTHVTGDNSNADITIVFFLFVHNQTWGGVVSVVALVVLVTV